MPLAPLLLERPPRLQLVLAVLVPVLFGVVSGVVLTKSEIAYDVLALVSVLGGVGAGLEHRGAREGATRGFGGGLLYGTGILLGAAIVGDAVKVELPDPVGVLVVVTTVAGALLGAGGGALRARLERRAAVA